MIYKRNWLKLTMIYLVSFVLSICLIEFNIININQIFLQGDATQLHILISSVIIMVSLLLIIPKLKPVLNKKRIKRLRNNHYLDNLDRSMRITFILNTIVFLLAYILLNSSFSVDHQYLFIYFEIIFFITGLIFFAWYTKQLTLILSIAKKNENT